MLPRGRTELLELLDTTNIYIFFHIVQLFSHFMQVFLIPESARQDLFPGITKKIRPACGHIFIPFIQGTLKLGERLPDSFFSLFLHIRMFLVP